MKIEFDMVKRYGSKNFNRNIEFRGKSKSNNEWVYGSFIQINKDGSPVSNILCKDSNVTVEVNRLTVGQSTDVKDKNNRIVYEHDILDIGGSDGIIYYWQGNYKIDKGSGISAFRLHDEAYVCSFEVIGNIHDK